MIFNKSLGIGVLIGIFLTVGVYMVVQKHAERVMAQKLAAFVEGYKNAGDKAAFVKGYNFEKRIAVNVSTLKAAEDGDELALESDSGGGGFTFLFQVAKCRELQGIFKRKFEQLNSFISEYKQAHEGSTDGIDSEPEYSQIMDVWNQATADWEKYKCADVYNYLR